MKYVIIFIMAHVGFHCSANEVIDLKLRAFQFTITATSNSSLDQTVDNTTLEAVKTHVNEGAKGFVHAKFTYNFCRKNSGSQIDQLIFELELANKAGCDVVIHQGKNVADESLTRFEALDNYIKHINEILERTFDLDNCLLLENSAHQGTELGYSLDELTYIYNQLDDQYKDRIGFCLDLCHIFVAGELDLRKAPETLEFFNQFDQSIGLQKLKCIHFNDSNVPFGGKNDFHGDIACGYISNSLLGGNPAGFQVVSTIAKTHGIPMIFETPCNFEHIHTEISQINWQVAIVKGWSEGDDSQYQTYLKDHQNLQQIAQAQLTSKSKLKSTCKCQTETAKPELKLTPKSAISLKSEPSLPLKSTVKIQLKKKD
jgi:apurinic endonuclease APN1